MEFVTIVHRAILASGRRVYVYMALSSIGTFVISVLVNTVTEYRPGDPPNYETMAAFILACAMTVVGRGETSRIMNAVGEGMAHHMRGQYARLLRDADLAQIETIGSEKIYATLARNAQILAESPQPLAQGLASAFTFALATIYVAYLSWFAALAIVVLVVIVFYAGQYRSVRTQEVMAEGQAAEGAFFESFNHYLRGLLEVRMDQRRADDLFENFLTVRARQARTARLGALDSVIAFSMVVIAAFYLLLGTVTFITPQFAETTAIAMKIVYTSSVMWLLIEGFMRIMPTILRGNAAFTELRKVERQLGAIQRPAPPPAPPLPPLQELEIDAIGFSYPPIEGESYGFSVGPSSLTLRPGEVTFIVGGNGSGKTTLLRTMLRLYTPSTGRILWNGRAVTEAEAADYRLRFAAVFADFHLFDRIYGQRDADPRRVTELLERVDLHRKTRYVDGRFTTLNLSSGQRKRLALAIALLEDREIYVFDEIAAEQDPEFRRRVYEEFFPELKSRGKVVLAITHDERYFDTADHLFFMEEGQLALRAA